MLSTLVRLSFILQALGVQIPFGLSPESSLTESERAARKPQARPWNSDDYLDSSYLDFSLWQLDEPPPANATGHLVFETVNSLLQHWPNTLYRNGHAIVPGVIPKGTLLYHGTSTNKIPTVLDWTATDPEHSFFFCRGSPDVGCWQLTLATTRPLKVLYFDGTSAAHTLNGTLDTQHIVAWGEFRPDWQMKEQQRLEDLCKWGAPYAADGYVRMEMDFEVMLCDFTAGLEVVSFSNLAGTIPVKETPALLISRGSIDSPMYMPIIYRLETSHAGSWHNRYPGDTRIILDLAGIVSLYDTTLAPSLVDIRAGQERCDHRIQGISVTDIERVRRSISDALERSQDDRSGVDWKTLFRVIVDRYSDRLDLINHLLSSTSEGDAHIDQARKVHVQLRIILTPYIFHDTAPANTSFDSSPTHYWATPVFKACGTTHTSSIASHASSLNPSERLLLRALQETTHEICRVTTNMWAAGVLAGLDVYLPLDSTPDAAEISHLVDIWRQQLRDLMEWLDWSVWVRCRPACGPEEMCYLPTWPVNAPRRQYPLAPLLLDEEFDNTDISSTSFADRASLRHSHVTMQLTDPVDDWRKPKPKCIRRVEPYGF